MPDSRPWLIAVSAPREVRAALDALAPHAEMPPVWGIVRVDGGVIVRCGVGKASAAGAVARWYDPGTHAGVLNVGVAGTLPGTDLPVGSVVLADPSVFADEGVRTPGGFLGLDRIGFGEDAPATPPDPASRAALVPLVDRVGPVATVSACSGADDAALGVAARTGGIAEAMEGAACGLVARRVSPEARFAELRVISNRTGDRERQGWDLDGALRRLTRVLGPALSALRG